MPPDDPPMKAARAGFTVIELLVVILIIGIVTAVALPAVMNAMSHRQVSESARILQAALAGARDSAIKNNAPSGIRLLPDPTVTGINTSTGLLDPTFPLAMNRLIPIGAAPDYTEGLVTVWDEGLPAAVGALAYPGPGTPALPAPTYAFTGALMLVEAPASNVVPPIPNPPTSWFWNIRLGDQIQINNVGPWYTVVGPMSVAPAGGNAELFVNVGPPGTVSPLAVGSLNPEFLLLVNGLDDNANGWIDEGWDGVDNDGKNGVDDIGEWEMEAWRGAKPAPGSQTPYTVRRRPAPAGNAREVTLPSNVVIDLTTWATTQERSRLPSLNQLTGYVDVLLNPNGTVVPTTLYSTPSSMGLGAAFNHFWLAERADVFSPTISPAGEWAIVTLFTRTGRIATVSNPPISNPFAAIQQGAQ